MKSKLVWKTYLLMAIFCVHCFGGGGVDCGHEDPINPADLTIVETKDAIDGRSVHWAAVANSRFDSVSLVDLNTFDYHNIAVGEYPQTIVSNGEAGWVATANRGSNDVSLIYLNDFHVDTFVTGLEPFDILAQRDSSNLWTANRGDGSVTIIDTFTYQTETLSGLAGVAKLVQSESGRTIYALAPRFGELMVIDADTREVRAVHQTGVYDHTMDVDFNSNMQITPNGRYLTITDSHANFVIIFNTETAQMNYTRMENFQPVFVTALADNETAYVSGRSDRFIWNDTQDDIIYLERPGNHHAQFGRMFSIDLVDGRPTREYVLDGLPQGGLVSKDGQRLYSPIYDSFRDEDNGDRYSEIVSFDLQTRNRWVIRVASYPWKIGLASGDNLLVVTHGNPLGGLTIIDTRTMETVFYRAGLAVGDR